MGHFQKFGTGKQDWETPDLIYSALDKEFGFTLDVCATENNAKCDVYYSPDVDGLSQRWSGVCWMNPPFNNQGKWMCKAYEEAQDGTIVVCLVTARTNTHWWHDYAMKGEIRFIRGRPKFKGAKREFPHPLAIVIFNFTEDAMKAGRELIQDILEDMPPDCYRWLFCMFDESDATYDCACCLMSRETIEEYQTDGHKCACVCHERIEKIAKYVAETLKAMENK